jgi:hypothetical protein
LGSISHHDSQSAAGFIVDQVSGLLEPDATLSLTDDASAIFILLLKVLLLLAHVFVA